MKIILEASPIAEAPDLLKTVIEEALGRTSALVIPYKDPLASQSLWASLRASEELTYSDVVIIYDGQADSTLHAFRPEHWLTPWDWAIALGVLASRNPRLLPTGFKCWIVDLLPRHWGSTGRSRFKTVGALTPWIRWYRPLIGERPLAHNLDDFFKDVKNRKELAAYENKLLPNSDSLSLVRAWSMLFSAPTDRHSIANFVGPLLLAEGIEKLSGIKLDLKADWSERTFRFLIGVSGLASTEASERPSQIDSSSYSIPELRNSIREYPSFDVLLIDDQFHNGYHAVLSQLLLGSDCEDKTTSEGVETTCRDRQTIRVRSASNPTILLKLMREAMAREPDWSRPRLLSRDSFDVLCLDLRLFPKSSFERPSHEERLFLCDLLAFCDKTSLPGETDDELVQAIKSARGRVDSGGEELHSLCLLPLLINRVDPSLPIILFSSSHQRDVVDLFRQSSSIITVFAKPIISEYAVRDLAIQCAKDLVKALQSAIRIRNVRGVWKSLCKLSKHIGPSGIPIHQARLTSKDNGRSVYVIGPELVEILSTEYLRLFLTGRLADAIQLPDNLLEMIGAKFMPPRSIGHYLDIFVLNQLRGDREWEAGIRKCHEIPERIFLVRSLIDHSLMRMAPNIRCQALKHAVRALAEHIGTSRSPQYDMMSFTSTYQHETAAIETTFGSVSKLVAKALDERLRYESAQLNGLQPDGEVIASYQFYAVLGAMRNGRSHFRVKPMVHDSEIEFSAAWLWLFFIEGLCLLATRKQPILTGSNWRVDDLMMAAAAQWFPRTNFVDSSEGNSFCKRIITAFGHLLRLKIFVTDPAFATIGDLAQKLAESEIELQAGSAPSEGISSLDDQLLLRHPTDLTYSRFEDMLKGL